MSCPYQRPFTDYFIFRRLKEGIRGDFKISCWQRTPLCSRVETGISWSSLGGLKGVKPPEAQICDDHLYVSWKHLFSKLTSPALPAFPIWFCFKSPFSSITLLWTNYRSFVHLSVCFSKLQPELPRWPGTYRGKIVLICSEKEVAHRMERRLVIQPAGHVFKLLTVYPSAM